MGTLLVLVMILCGTFCQATATLCDRPECICNTASTRWKNITCVFDNKEITEIGASSLPSDLLELEIVSSKELHLLPGSFSRQQFIELLRIRNVGQVIIKKEAFLNLSSAKLRLEIMDCDSLLLTAKSFRSIKGPVTAVLERIPYVVIENSSFSWLVDLIIRYVPRLVLKENAFLLESPNRPIGVHGPTTKILLDTVKVDEVPKNVFSSPAAHLSIVNSDIHTVRSSAFSAIQIASVTIQNTSLYKVESAAIKDGTLIKTLEIIEVKLHTLATNAWTSAISNLVIHQSNLSEVHEGAFNITVASVTLTSNMFKNIHSRGFILKDWSSMIVENNTFKHMRSNAIQCAWNTASDIEPKRSPPTFIFIRNFLVDVETDVLAFSTVNELDVTIDNNFFMQTCLCEINSKLNEIMNVTEQMLEIFYDTSMCHLDSFFARCFSLPVGYINMHNFSDLVCGANKIKCEEVIQSDAAIPPHIPGLTSDILDERHGLDRERRVIFSIFVFVICGMIVMMLFSGFMWLRRNGYCTKARLLLLPSTNSLLNIITRLITRSRGTTGSAQSISRTSIHEYAELHGQKGIEISEDEVELEDKATQTLPEELTQELLQSLRDKLDDPENYSEARDMIEHLYDLIKVEESCNQNYKISVNLDIEDEREGGNVYDVIQPTAKVKTNKVPREKKSLVSVGTRAPSPDKLLPITLSYGEPRKRPAIMCEYIEPKDKQPHLYAELPEVPPPEPTRPLSFIRMFGENVFFPSSVLCDYNEPTDATVHVYSELPNGMANRPLPSKPDQGQDDPGEGPSSSPR